LLFGATIDDSRGRRVTVEAPIADRTVAPRVQPSTRQAEGSFRSHSASNPASVPARPRWSWTGPRCASSRFPGRRWASATADDSS